MKPAKSKLAAFRLSNEALLAIKNLSFRFSQESRIQISMAKIIEIAIFNAETKSLSELLEFDK